MVDRCEPVRNGRFPKEPVCAVGYPNAGQALEVEARAKALIKLRGWCQG